MISLKQIRYALAVAKERHFKRAAEACNVSQSALSTAISELETQLGVLIFERDNKKVLITPLGEQILKKAQEIKLQVDDLHNLSFSQRDLLSFPMTIGVIPTIAPFLLPKVLPTLRSSYPSLDLKLVEGQSAELIDQVRDGSIDTAILALPYTHDGLHAFEFWQENFFLATHRSSDYAKKTEVLSSQINTQDLLLLQDGHCLKDHILDVCSLKKADHTGTLAGTSLYTLIQMVAANMGTTLVPEMALEQLSKESPQLKFIPLKEKGPHRTIAFISRLSYSRVSSLEALMVLFKQLLNHAPA